MADFNQDPMNPYGMPTDLGVPEPNPYAFMDSPEFLAAMAGQPLQAAVSLPSLPGSQSTDAPRPPPPPPPPPKPVAPPKGFDPKDPATWGAPGAGPRSPSHGPAPLGIGMDESPGLPGATDEWSLDEIGAAMRDELVDPYAEPAFPSEPIDPYAGDFEPAFDSPGVPTEPPSAPGALGNLWDQLTGQEAAPEPEAEFPGLVDPYSDETRDAEVERLASLDPETFAVIQGKKELAKEDFIATERLKAAAADRRQAEDDARAHQVATQRANEALEKLDADTSALANERIDPDRWWSERSTGQKIAGYLMAMVGGWMATERGGRNSGLDLIMSAIDQDIDAQKANLAHRTAALGARRGVVADMFARATDANEAATKIRLTSLKALENDIDARASMLDPQGTGFMRLAAIKRGVRTEIEQGKQAAAEAAYKRNFEFEKEIVIPRERIAQDERQSKRAAYTARRGQDLDQQQHRDRMGLEDRKLAGEIEKANASGNAEYAKLLRTNGIPGAVLKDGTPLMARTEKEGQELREMRTGTYRAVNIINEMKDLIGRHGGINGAIASSEGQRLTAAAGALMNEMRLANKMGTLDAGAQSALKAMAGGSDITGWKSFLPSFGVGSNASAGLEQAARLQLGKYNEALRSQDENAQEITIKDFANLPGAQETQAESDYQRVTAARTPDEMVADEEPGIIVKGLGYVARPLPGSDRRTNAQKAAAAEAEASASLTNPGVTKDQAKLLDTLARRGTADDIERLTAMATSDRPGLASGAITALADAGNLSALEEIGASAPTDSDLAVQVRRAREVAASVRVDQLGKAAAAGDANAQRVLLQIVAEGDGEIREQAAAALVGKPYKPTGKVRP